MPIVIAVPIKRDICLRVDGADGEPSPESTHIFVQVKKITPRKAYLQLVLPDDVRLLRSPDEGQEDIWPDKGINCANERRGYELKSKQRSRR